LVSYTCVAVRTLWAERGATLHSHKGGYNHKTSEQNDTSRRHSSTYSVSSPTRAPGSSLHRVVPPVPRLRRVNYDASPADSQTQSARSGSPRRPRARDHVLRRGLLRDASFSLLCSSGLSSHRYLRRHSSQTLCCALGPPFLRLLGLLLLLPPARARVRVRLHRPCSHDVRLVLPI
jgi:hypothetical protein